MKVEDEDAREIRQQSEEIFARLISRVDELRQKQSMTLKFLGDASQLGQAYVSQLLQGKKNPTLVTLVKLAYALETNVLDLLKVGPVSKPKVKLGRPRTRRLPK